MNIGAFIQIEAVPFLALALTLYISLREFKTLKNIRRFQLLVALVMCILVVDGLNWYTVAYPMALPAWVIWLSNIVYFLLTEIIAYLWFLYVFHQVFGSSLSERQRTALKLSVIPLAAMCIIIAASPLTHHIFSIDPVDQTYSRGELHVLQTVCGFSYMLAASVAAFIQSRRARLSEQKKECRFLCFIVILPLAGGILQIINYYFVFLWCFTAAAAFLIFIDFQSHKVSVDSLTSLNNRGSLEQYLQAREKEGKLSGYLMMMDVDRFKGINDKYGHIEGDRALKLTAQMLRTVFGASGAFLARYGGDEFVVLAELYDPENAITQCEDELLRLAEQHRLSYRIRLSIGYAKCGSEAETAAELLKAADSMMFERKKYTATDTY